MVKLSQQNPKNTTVSNGSNNNSSAITSVNNGGVVKVKRTRRSVPRDSPPQRSSIYRGVTRHRWTGRYEAHLWDKNCWNESQNKKGRQVYLGAYDDEEAAAHAYDLAALKYWGRETILNFPLATYEKELSDMEGQSREEYIGSLRRKSSGFSRGVSKYRGVARHHHNGRWEARIGRVFGNKYLYLGTYATQEEAAIAYDMAAIEYRGLNAVTNFDLSRYIKWLKPDNGSNQSQPARPTVDENLIKTTTAATAQPNHQDDHAIAYIPMQPTREALETMPTPHHPRPANATSALGLLLQSSKFREMMEMTSAADCMSSPDPRESLGVNVIPNKCSFPEEIQTYFECQESSSFEEGDDIIFGGLNAFVPPLFQCDLDA